MGDKAKNIIKNCRDDQELSLETLESIEKAREMIKKGKFLTEEEARLKLGL